MDHSKKIKTPYFLISENKLKKNLILLESIQKKANIDIILALKAFSCPHFIPQINKHLKGSTASSLNEAKLAKEFTDNIHIYAPAYKTTEIKELATLGNYITFNSISQYLNYKKIVKASNPNIKIGIRLNPEHSEVSYNLYDPCCPYSRLGVTKKELNLSHLEDISGIHIHNLCGKNEDALIRTLYHIENKFPDLLKKVEWLNLGGGHGLTYKNYDHNSLIKNLKKIKEKYKLHIILEPGEAVVYDTGKLIASVVDIMHNEVNIAILDTSASAHMPDILEMPYRPEIENAGLKNKKKYTYRLGGITCLAGDIMGDYSFDTPLKIGDTLTFKDMAHYTMVKSTWFNGLMLPTIAKETADGDIKLIKIYDYDQYRQTIG